MKYRHTLPGFLLILCLMNGQLPLIGQQGNDILHGAVWITGSYPVIETDSLYYLDQPAPILRTEFTVTDDILKAEMLITAAGYYESWLNGNRVGDQQLDPAWTDFSRRVYVTAIDITSMIQKGKNIWGILLGNGFYNPLPLRLWGNRNLRKDMASIGKPCVIAKILVSYKNGTQQVFCTSDQWKTKPGPIIKNNVYLGEWYDGRKEVPNWNTRGAKLKGWEPVEVVTGPGGQPVLSTFPPIKITRWLEPVDIRPCKTNTQVIDFGQNFAGWIRVRIEAKRGDTIRFRYGELLYPDGSLNPMTAVCGQIKKAGTGGPGAPAIAEQTDVYISKGDGPEYFQPRFTFHGFRYVEVTGLPVTLQKTNIKAARINSDVKPAMNIHGASAYLNKLNEICQWTFLSNLQSVQSDCPAREKFGYGGDIIATNEAYIYNFDMHDMYRKIVFDWVDALKDSGFIDTAPFVGIEYCGLNWESAFIFLQNALLIHYGDKDLIKQLYRTDQAWMEKVSRIHPDLVVDKGLSDHECLAAVPVELLGTCHYYQVARIMTRFAGIVDDAEGVKQYSALADKIQQKILDLFWDSPNIVVPNQQTFLATLLASDVLHPSDQAIAMQRLLDVLKQADYHVTTGIFGTKYLLEALSRFGRTDIAFRVVNQSGFPGWKYMIDNGATTVWETWKASDNTFSQNHPMFGSVSGWYIKWLGGIQPDPDVMDGKSVILNPCSVAELDSLSVEKFYPSGSLISHWWKEDRCTKYEFVIPAGLNAKWIEPTIPGKLVPVVAPLNWDFQQNRDAEAIHLKVPGRYIFMVNIP